MMPHDFIKFPELTNSQMDIYYFDSPHKQIFEPFTARVTKVTDGDTIRVRWRERNFDFPVRFLNIQAPEMRDAGGKESQSWLEEQILNEEVEIIIDAANRVEKWGRLMGVVMFRGIDMGEVSQTLGHSKPWNLRDDGIIQSMEHQLRGSEIR